MAIFLNKNARTNPYTENEYEIRKLLLNRHENPLQSIDENSKTLRGEVNYQDRKGWTPLMYAALNGNAKLVARLHAAGAKVNCR